MKGQTHAIIGGTTALLVGAGLTYMNGGVHTLNSGVKVGETITAMVSGGVIAGFLVDADSKKSKASQMVSRIAVGLCWLFLLAFISKRSEVSHLLAGHKQIAAGVATFSVKANYITGLILSYCKSSWALSVFCVLVTLGKLSPHRGFTHRILGIISFCVTAWFTFSAPFAIGFIIGYIMHPLADKQTEDGVEIFELRLPLQNSKGELSIHW